MFVHIGWEPKIQVQPKYDVMIDGNELPALYSYVQKSKRKRDAGRPRIRRKARFKERFFRGSDGGVTQNPRVTKLRGRKKM
jgi:hypothetical protein